MQILLAPMEGLLDHTLRDVLTRLGGVDRCVSEFIRVTDTLLPERAFRRIVPELDHGGFTPFGVAVRPQLLGSDPACLADNAGRLGRISPHGVDLNFGCPAKVVNRHGGGAALLQEPDLLLAIVQAVRRAVPAHLPVSAKMRLGFHDDARAEECALALQEGGASELVVHARTRAQGYKPPAYWRRIADVRAVVSIPVVANGEIWTVDDARRCLSESGSTDLMIGRGLVADPGLAWAIHAELGDAGHPASVPASRAQTTAPPRAIGWPDIHPLLGVYWQRVCDHLEVPRHRAGRLKQWLNYLRRVHPQAESAFQEVRAFNECRQIEAWLQQYALGPTAGSPQAQPA